MPMHGHGSPDPKALEKIQKNHTLLRKIRSIFRGIFAIPDYEQYLDYWHAGAFPAESRPMSREDFFNQSLHERYGKGKTNRCC